MSIQNGPNTLASLFNDNILVIPSFQRAFAWEKPQLRNFIDDIRSHPVKDKNGKNYFFGTILLTRTQGNSPIPLYESYSVVDGQQRLTTTCIFVSVAIEKLKLNQIFISIAKKFYERILQNDQIRKFHTISEDDAFFDRLLFPEGSCVSEKSCDTPSKKRLFEAKVFFEQEIALIDDDSIKYMLTTLWDAQILVYAVNTNAEATQIFELQNDRGKRLTNLEALKSFLMHGLYVHAGNSTENDLNVVQQNFAIIYRNVEKMEPLYDSPDEDQLLSFHCIAFEPWKKLESNTDGWREPKELIRQLLLKKNLDDRAAWIKEFSNRLQDSYEFAFQILQSMENNESIPMGNLAVLGRVASFWPLLLKCWRQDGQQGKPNFNKSVQLMVKFSFRSMMAGKRSDVGETYLQQLASDFSGDFIALNITLKNFCTEWDIPRFFEFNLDSEKFYDKGLLATYLLWQYENHLRSQTGTQNPRLHWNTLVRPMNHAIRYAKDHIEAKDPSNPTLSRLVKWDESDKEERPFSDVYLHRLGNLVLDNISMGAAKGNRDFSSRISHYTGNSTFLSQGEIVNIFANKDPISGDYSWDEIAIRKRHKVLVDFALNNL